MATQKQVPAARRNVKSAQAAAPAEENDCKPAALDQGKHLDVRVLRRLRASVAPKALEVARVR